MEGYDIYFVPSYTERVENTVSYNIHVNNEQMDSWTDRQLKNTMPLAA